MKNASRCFSMSCSTGNYQLSRFRFSFCCLILSALLCCFPVRSVWCQSLPEFFGIYGVVDGKLVPLVGGKGNLTPGKSSIQILNYLEGTPGEEISLVLQGNDFHLIVFDAAVADASTGVELYKLPYARNVITQSGGGPGGLLVPMIGQKPVNTVSPLQKYVIAKADELKIELLQKPVSGQPQMIQLVPDSNLEPGFYCLFTVHMQGLEKVIFHRIFEWKGSSGISGTSVCIDMLRSGSLLGGLADHDTQMEHPFYMAKENYVSCQGTGALGPSSSGGSANSAGSGSSVQATCNDYNSCFQTGAQAYRQKDWPAATANLQAAAKYQPTNGNLWVSLGRITLLDNQPHPDSELTDDWNKALSLGASLRIATCHELTMRPCERGDIVLSTKSVAFLARGSQEVFSAAPADVKFGRIVVDDSSMQTTFNLKVANKNYVFDPIPSGFGECQFSVMVQCPTEQMAEQLVLAQYIAQAIEKLASGALVNNAP